MATAGTRVLTFFLGKKKEGIAKEEGWVKYASCVRECKCEVKG